ncbi:MocR-like pyridoxine biosynthesis transcription factor PdxR [Actinomadura montaniterrae]|uniref:PLP-dependent aminotransferase family protein n=1 Tax=Actinomadura montaniterrae TaxID=1803903 RepID=A0A6L3VKF1_9ACTN|nr:PLP-dependent aminotransferase family protein [Actinomadura montaniterrae]KAB2371718.1 PLP-dependent aminotransferase family protein [Actinomadura montaniterrae]
MHRSNGGASDQSITGSDFLQLDTAEAPPGGLAAWLARRLREAIGDGRLPVGSRLPATRVLAADLRVSRGVVTDAYQRLIDDGHVAGRGRAGTIVVAAPLTAPPPPPGRAPERPQQAETPEPPQTVFPGRPGADAFDVLRAAPARIDLSPGVPDLAAFPRAAWLRAERRVLSTLAAPSFGYGDPRGTPALRTAVAGWLARNRGIRADPADIVVVAGTAQALGLLSQVLRAAGVGAVAVEDPGSLGTRQHLEHWGMRTPPVPVDDRGARVDALRRTGAPAVLLTPAHQFPTGTVLHGARRRALMDWAAAGGLIIEDDYDAEHRYDRPPVPALRAMLADRVFYAGSVSKLLAPALRTGWVLAPPRHRDALVDAKRFADLGNAALPQLVLADLMESGEMERQLRTLRRRHRARRDTMIAAIRARLPGAVVHGAAAGLHLLVTFPERPGLRDADLAAAALARGVKTQPLSWHAQRPGPPGLVLGYAATAPSAIDDGVTAIAAALRDLT